MVYLKIKLCFLIPSNLRGLKLLIVTKSFCITENLINFRQAFFKKIIAY